MERTIVASTLFELLHRIGVKKSVDYDTLCTQIAELEGLYAIVWKGVMYIAPNYDSAQSLCFALWSETFRGDTEDWPTAWHITDASATPTNSNLYVAVMIDGNDF